MGYRYAVVGAGRQGIAAAYDLAKFGDAESILIIDRDFKRAKETAWWLAKQCGRNFFYYAQAEAGTSEMDEALKGVHAFVSAVPYQFNLALSKTALAVGASMCDLGGNTEVVLQQHQMHDDASAAGISIIPDCGMGPGMNVSLAVFAMKMMDKPREVLIYDGGLPEKPVPPWNYYPFFDIEGLLNEYSGNAYFLREGKVVEVPALSNIEPFLTDELGMLEAFVTSGGLSTAPWTFQDKLERLENKTLRYPGHCELFKVLADLGLFDRKTIVIEDKAVAPRNVLGELLCQRLMKDGGRDMALIHIACTGEHRGKKQAVTADLVKRFDEKTGLTAMQYLTGSHASMMTIYAAHGKLEHGVISVEKTVVPILEETSRRGLFVSFKLE